jgi:hypothetical protein
VTARTTQGDTAPNFFTTLFVDGTYMDLAGGSVIMRVGGTVGALGYQSWHLGATFNTAASPGCVVFPLNPCGLAPTNFPAASPAHLSWDVRAVASGGAIYHWPRTEAPDFIVRPRV